jgi:hypothetical protein
MTNSPVSHVVSEKLVKEEPDQYGQQHPIENSDVLEVFSLHFSSCTVTYIFGSVQFVPSL